VKNKMKAPLRRADATFWNAPEFEGADRIAMKAAFFGVAKVLFEIGFLTTDILQKELPILVWEAAIAAGWYRFAAETPSTIFPEKIGRYHVWRDPDGDWSNLFRVEIQEWSAQLVENPVGDTLHSSNAPAASATSERNGAPPERASGPIAPPEIRQTAMQGDLDGAEANVEAGTAASLALDSSAKGGRPPALAIVGEKVSELRGDRSQPTIARLTKLSVDVIQRAEQGQATPKTIKKLCQFAKSIGFPLTSETLKKTDR
jgi:hypothetical protein